MNGYMIYVEMASFVRETIITIEDIFLNTGDLMHMTIYEVIQRGDIMWIPLMSEPRVRFILNRYVCKCTCKQEGNMLPASLALKKKGNIFRRILVLTGVLRSSSFGGG